MKRVADKTRQLLSKDYGIAIIVLKVSGVVFVPSRSRLFVARKDKKEQCLRLLQQQDSLLRQNANLENCHDNK